MHRALIAMPTLILLLGTTAYTHDIRVQANTITEKAAADLFGCSKHNTWRDHAMYDPEGRPSCYAI